MKSLTIILIFTILLGTCSTVSAEETIDTQIEAIKTATPSERRELINSLKQEIAQLNKQEQTEAIAQMRLQLRVMAQEKTDEATQTKTQTRTKEMAQTADKELSKDSQQVKTQTKEQTRTKEMVQTEQMQNAQNMQQMENMNQNQGANQFQDMMGGMNPGVQTDDTFGQRR